MSGWRRFGGALLVGALVMSTALPVAVGEEESASVGPVPGASEAVEEQRNAPRLEESIGRILADGELQRTAVGIHVVDLDTGAVLYTRDADRLMNPASNVKLVTAAVVLDELGPNHTFATELLTQQRRGERIEDLYVRGEGEAFLLFRDVLSWAGELRMQGVEVIDGDVVIDDGAFDGAYSPPGFDMRDADAAYRSPIGAVSVNFNAVAVTVKPAQAVGQPPTVRVDPPNAYIEVVNRARTAPGALPRIGVTAQPNGERTQILVTGSIGVSNEGITQRKRIEHPPAFAGAVIAEALAMVGIEVEGEVRRGTTPEASQRLVLHHSQPLINAVAAMNKWSNNFIAEQLLRTLGNEDDHASTWERALQRAQTRMTTYGFEPDSFSLFNGSGLYDGNELSARQVVRLLEVMSTHRYGPEFVSSLAIAGEDGTLRSRLRGEETRGNLRGKTGTLRDVTALSGYVTSASGHRLAFSILFNDPPRRAWNYRNQQDAIARAIAAY